MIARLRIENLRSAHAGPFNLTLAPGECIAITGQSGSGKTLFLRMLADLDPSEGMVALDGQDRRCYPAPTWRARVTYCAAEPGWWANTIVSHFSPETSVRAAQLAPALGLDPALLKASVAQLSTGERQRFALIRGLVLKPAVLLLDEPTGSLDTGSTERVEWVLAESASSGTSIVMVTHNPAQAQRLGARQFRMQSGRLHPA